VFREYLTQPYEFAAAGYLLARRVGEARYFEVLDTIFRQQDAIFASEDHWGGLLKIGKSFRPDRGAVHPGPAGQGASTPSTPGSTGPPRATRSR
jgi:hypothetical protein